MESFLFSEQVISSGGLSFSLSFPVPISSARSTPTQTPTPTPLPNSAAQKSFFGSVQPVAGSTLGQANGSMAKSTSTTSAASSWSTQNGVDEDYDT